MSTTRLGLTGRQPNDERGGGNLAPPGNVTMGQFTHVFCDALEAARTGRSLRKYWTGVPGSASATVLTNASIVHDMVVGTQAVAVKVNWGVTTLNDSCVFEVGWCTAVTGGGTFTPICRGRHFATGTARDGRSTAHEMLVLPRIVKYSDGARSITMRVTANDTSTDITCAWHGWVESET